MIDFENILVKLKEEYSNHTFDYKDNSIVMDGKHNIKIDFDDDALGKLEEYEGVDVDGFLFREVNLQIQNKLKLEE